MSSVAILCGLFRRNSFSSVNQFYFFLILLQGLLLIRPFPETFGFRIILLELCTEIHSPNAIDNEPAKAQLNLQ